MVDNTGAYTHLPICQIPPFPFTVQAGTGGAEHFYAFYLYAGWFETREYGATLATNHQYISLRYANPALLTIPWGA